MEFLASSLEQVRSASGALVDRFRDQGITQYWPLEERGNLYLPSRSQTDTGPSHRSSRTRKAIWAAIGVVVVVMLVSLGTITSKRSSPDRSGHKPVTQPQLPQLNSYEHPISQLVKNADAQFQSSKAAQSTTLHQAINEYHRRYGMPPPPHFDKWYKFAVDRKTELIDEYDAIYDSLVLFWSLSPDEIRRRTREGLGHDNFLMGVSIRGGVVRTVGRGQDHFQEPATKDMISSFAQWLPDMDLAFNVNDESRVLIPHEDVSRMKSMAKTATESIKPVSNAFTRPDDLNDGESYEHVTETRFNHLDHQQTWAHSRMSCAPDTPARSLDPLVEDAQTGVSFNGINFVADVDIFSDVCLSPSVRNVIGLFNHPNVFAVSHDLVPVFSPSKISTFHDILYPSPYYYADRTVYDPGTAVQWEDKISKMYWRGATSGGYSQDGSWRTLLRQSILTKLMSPGTVRMFSREDEASGGVSWTTKEVSGPEVSDRYDTQFTEIKQCEPADCSAMRAHFGIHSHTPQEDSWKHRYLLDMDGNALSGRFYALMKSFSLPLKVAYYREWHAARLFPWKHYVPLSASTDEYAEVLRYFEEEEEGKEIAKNLALEGRTWAEKTIRKDDMEVYMFRLLLEYGRLVDDNRQQLGYRE